MSDTPHPRYTEEEVDQTINEDSPVDEASFESFPASDPPAFSQGRVGPVDLPRIVRTTQRDNDRSDGA